MTRTDTRNELGITVAKDLRTVMQGKVAIAGEASYEGARQVFNGAVDRRPTLFAFCESARDVQEAVRAARAYGLPLSVRGGGHDWVGRALSHHGLVVDLSRMRQVEVDVRGRVATVVGGALAGDVIAAVGPHGLAAVTGAAGTVGLAGLLTGGGYGPLLPRFGLALDNLLGGEIVLADGQIVFVDSSQNSELFWAIRGGGRQLRSSDFAAGASASDRESLGWIYSFPIGRSHVSVDWLLQVCQFSSRRAFGYRGYCFRAGWQALRAIGGSSKRGESAVRKS